MQLVLSHKLFVRLSWLSARHGVTFQATDHHHPLTSIRLYCLVTEVIDVNNLPIVITWHWCWYHRESVFTSPSWQALHHRTNLEPRFTSFVLSVFRIL